MLVWPFYDNRWLHVRCGFYSLCVSDKITVYTFRPLAMHVRWTYPSMSVVIGQSVRFQSGQHASCRSPISRARTILLKLFEPSQSNLSLFKHQLQNKLHILRTLLNFVPVLLFTQSYKSPRNTFHGVNDIDGDKHRASQPYFHAQRICLAKFDWRNPRFPLLNRYLSSVQNNIKTTHSIVVARGFSKQPFKLCHTTTQNNNKQFSLDHDQQHTVRWLIRAPKTDSAPLNPKFNDHNQPNLKL